MWRVINGGCDGDAVKTGWVMRESEQLEEAVSEVDATLLVYTQARARKWNQMMLKTKWR